MAASLLVRAAYRRTLRVAIPLPRVNPISARRNPEPQAEGRSMGERARARQSGVMLANELHGRQAECERLAGLVDYVRNGGSAVLVMHGEPGIGKTALLDFTAELDTGLKVVRAVGAESETELAFGGLHRLCGTMLDLLGRLPGPQREALAIAFGRRAGPAPDRFV